MGEAGGDGELLRQYRLLGRTGEGSQIQNQIQIQLKIQIQIHIQIPDK